MDDPQAKPAHSRIPSASKASDSLFTAWTNSSQVCRGPGKDSAQTRDGSVCFCGAHADKSASSAGKIIRRETRTRMQGSRSLAPGFESRSDGSGVYRPACTQPDPGLLGFGLASTPFASAPRSFFQTMPS